MTAEEFPADEHTARYLAAHPGATSDDVGLFLYFNQRHAPIRVVMTSQAIIDAAFVDLIGHELHDLGLLSETIVAAYERATAP